MGFNHVLPVCLLFLVVGCLEDARDPAATPSPTSPSNHDPTTLPWVMSECRFIAAVIPVPQSAVAPYLPEGFRSLAPNQLPPPLRSSADPANNANFGFETFACKSGQGLNGTVDNFAYGSFYSAVEPPEALKRTDVDYTFYKWDVLIPDEARRAVLQEAGVRAWPGTTSVTEQVYAQSEAAVSGTVTFNASETYDLVGNALVPQDPATLLEFTAAKGGFATWHAKATFVNGGIGPVSVRAPAGSFAAKVMGGTQAQGAGFLGLVNFSDGTITLPANTTMAAS